MNISVYQKHIARNTLWIFLLIIFFVIGMTAGKAFASEPTIKLSLSVPEKPSKRPEVKILPSIPTTTTTTLKPKPEVQTIATKKTVPVASPSQANWTIQCRTWLAEVGIVGSDQDSAIALIDRESDCGPTARNPRSSAGGIPQALPWTKMGCPLENTNEAALCQIRWMNNYVTGRYGGWTQALNHSHTKGWY